MITQEILLNNKYKQFESTFEQHKYPDNYISSFQKRFDDKKGKKYFITLHLYDFHIRHNDKYKNTYVSDTQFYIPRSEKFHDDETFNVEYFIDENTTIEMLEKFFEKVWNSMGCRYYELWSEC